MWTDEAVTALKQMWDEGISASKAAQQLNRLRLMQGCSRNAVIGKVHRMGWERRGPSAPRTCKPKPTRNAKPNIIAPKPVFKEPPAPLTPLLREDGTFTTVLTLNERTCKWPIGDPAEQGFAFCGRQSCKGPYCADHAMVAYAPPHLDKKRAERGSNKDLRRLIWMARL